MREPKKMRATGDKEAMECLRAFQWTFVPLEREARPALLR